MNESKLISVIIPVYNCENYLDKCLRSVLSQTYENLEVLLIDDGSSDSSPEICDKDSEQDARVKAFHIKNGGVSNARNFGMSQANGDYIAFVDSDDYIMTDMYEKLLSKASETNSDMVFCRYQKVSDDGSITEENHGLEEFIKEQDLSVFIVHTKNLVMGSSCRILYKKSFVDSLKFNSDLILGEDLLFVLELLTSTKNIAYVPNVLYNYYYNNNVNYRKYVSNPRYLSSQELLAAKIAALLEKSNRCDLARYMNWHIYSSTVKTALLSENYKAVIKQIKSNRFWQSLNNQKNYISYKKLNRLSSRRKKVGDFFIRHNLFSLYQFTTKLRG